MESKKVKKPKSKVRKIIEWVATGILGVVFVFAAACNISKLVTKTNDREGHAFGYYSFKVLATQEAAFDMSIHFRLYRQGDFI